MRIFFWFGERFETPLLVQSVLMILMQLILLELCVHLRSTKKYSGVGSPSGRDSDREPLTKNNAMPQSAQAYFRKCERA